jgi:pyrroloquinoline quinone biosynthesis protein E
MIKEVSLDLTYDCPFKCIHCSNPSDVKDVSVNALLESLQYLLDTYDVQVVEVGGGEPLIHKKFIEVSELVPKSVRKILYTSGGVGFDGNAYVSRSDADILKKVGYQQANVSFFSVQKDIHNYFFGAGDVYTNTLKTIKNMVDAGLHVCGHVVLTKINYSQVVSTVTFLKEIGVNDVRFLRFVAQGRGKINRKKLGLTIGHGEVISLLSNIRTIFPNMNVSIAGFPEIQPCRPHDSIKLSCPAGLEFVHINVDGSIVPCPSFKNSSSLKYDYREIHNISCKFPSPREFCLRTMVNENIIEGDAYGKRN